MDRLPLLLGSNSHGLRTIISLKHKAYKRVSLRLPFMQREKSAYIILRRKGVSYNQIADCFGRSVSVVFNAIRKARFFASLRREDLRKLPRRRREFNASKSHFFMVKLRAAWEAWVCGEGERPP